MVKATSIDKIRTFGLILTGGKSSRMGRDKFLIQYHNKPQYLHLHDLLQGLCDEVFISCNESQLQLIDPLINTIIDEDNFEGPLQAIKNAFEKYQVNWLIIPCDMPNLNENIINKILETKSDQLVKCALDTEERINPLLALYLAKNKESLSNFSKKSATAYVEQVGYSTIKLSALESLNINTLADYQNFSNN